MTIRGTIHDTGGASGFVVARQSDHRYPYLIKTLCLATARDAPCGFAELTMGGGARLGFRPGFSKPTADGQNL